MGARGRTVNDSVVASLLAGDNDVGDAVAFLPPFRSKLELAVAIQHAEEAVGGVSAISNRSTFKVRAEARGNGHTAARPST